MIAREVGFHVFPRKGFMFSLVMHFYGLPAVAKLWGTRRIQCTSGTPPASIPVFGHAMLYDSAYMHPWFRISAPMAPHTYEILSICRHRKGGTHGYQAIKRGLPEVKARMDL